MNKITTINLGGYPLTIDDNAYDYLDKYLRVIHQHFAQNVGCEEIMEDIENRMGELLNERLKKKRIISIQDVKAIVEIMGKPEDIGCEPINEFSSEAEPEKAYAGSESGNYRTGKRFFRNEDDKVLGGVCSGVAAYFGITEPLWIRLAMVVLVIAGVGFPVIAYVILWAITPAAKTPHEKLAMKGKKINVENIANIVEREIEDVANGLNELNSMLKSKRKEKMYR